jgi:hypothetical protein
LRSLVRQANPRADRSAASCEVAFDGLTTTKRVFIRNHVAYEAWRIAGEGNGDPRPDYETLPRPELPGELLTGKIVGEPPNKLIGTFDQRIEASARFLDELAGEQRTLGGLPDPSAEDYEAKALPTNEKETVS